MPRVKVTETMEVERYQCDQRDCKTLAVTDEPLTMGRKPDYHGWMQVRIDGHDGDTQAWSFCSNRCMVKWMQEFNV